MTETPSHISRPDIINCLKRADGHLRSVTEMLEAGRPCLVEVQQVQAVEKAVAQARKALIHDHIDHCLENTTGPLPHDQRARVEEFKLIIKYL